MISWSGRLVERYLARYNQLRQNLASGPHRNAGLDKPHEKMRHPMSRLQLAKPILIQLHLHSSLLRERPIPDPPRGRRELLGYCSIGCDKEEGRHPILWTEFEGLTARTPATKDQDWDESLSHEEDQTQRVKLRSEALSPLQGLERMDEGSEVPTEPAE